ncbi:MAG TPA: hypothetical protein DD473_17250 [Planctomycetaceae bacterium]|nr:hypothetical protein [Planctomycetaceae bacterium]
MKNLLTGFACLSLVLAPIFSTQAEVARTTKTKSAVSDIALSNGGALNGKAVTGQGQALNGAKVSVRRNNEVVATTVTDADGKFTVAGLDTGIYELQAGEGKGVVRAWEGSVAPPTSKSNVLIVSGATTTRAQSGLFVDPLDTITLGLSITGVALGAAALSQDNETIIVSP